MQDQEELATRSFDINLGQKVTFFASIISLVNKIYDESTYVTVHYIE